MSLATSSWAGRGVGDPGSSPYEEEAGQWCGLLTTFPLRVCGRGRARLGQGLLRLLPWKLWGWAQLAPLQPGASPTDDPATLGGLGLPATPETLVTRLFTCHPLCKPISVVFILFCVNIKKVKRIKTFLLQFPHLGCHEAEWSPGLRDEGYGQREGRLRRWLAAREPRRGSDVR